METSTYVYFIQSDGYVKIGFSTSLPKRLEALESSSPIDLKVVLLILGDHELEAVFHERFKDYRVRREWFRLEGALAEFINNEDKTIADAFNSAITGECPCGAKSESIETFRGPPYFRSFCRKCRLIADVKKHKKMSDEIYERVARQLGQTYGVPPLSD